MTSSVPEGWSPNGGKPQLTVLIANDQEWSARSLESIFAAEGYGVVRAFTAAQAIKQAEATHPDLIILDRQMPDLDGAEVCRRLRADPRIGVTTPIIITTAGQAGRAQKAEAFEAGAWDFLGQPIDGEILLHKVRTFLQAKLALENGSAEALVDSGTGLYTRKGLDRRAREIVAEARRTGQPVACVVFSATDPELVAVVDRVEDFARRVARFFQESGRAADAVGRLGPLEFGVIAPGTSAEGAARMMERLQQVISGGDGAGSLRASLFAPDSLEELPGEPEELLARAGAVLRSTNS
ncbi:MAG: response regulator [Gemmatimonadales bacterium]